jgi:hypothetical protein
MMSRAQFRLRIIPNFDPRQARAATQRERPLRLALPLPPFLQRADKEEILSTDHPRERMSVMRRLARAWRADVPRHGSAAGFGRNKIYYQ